MAHRLPFWQFVLVAACYLAGNSAAHGTLYYVRTDGDDANSGTGSDVASAWATVNHAATQPLTPGDVVIIKAGAYTEYVEPTVNGTPSARIYFLGDTTGSVSGWDAGKVLLQAPPDSQALAVNGDNYLTFFGLQFAGSTTLGVLVQNQTEAVFSSCVFSAGSRPMSVNNGDALLLNCVVRDSSGSGVRVVSGTARLWNCTIVDNNANGITQDDGVCSITNCIIANNGNSGIAALGGTITHTYNLLYGNHSGNYSGTTASTGEISADPHFFGNGDYRFGDDSPAVDSGTDASSVLTSDFRGVARPQLSGWDLGAYESKLNEGLRAHYKFDETSGTTAVDSSGNGADGAYSGSPVLATDGTLGSAVSLNATGVDDYIDLPSTLLNGLSTLSVSFWIKTDRTSSQSVISSTNSGWDNEFLVFFENHRNLSIYVHGTKVTWSTPSIADGKWRHFAIVMDGANDQITIYRDAVSLGTKTHGPGGTPLRIDAGGLLIGQEQDCVGGCFSTNQILQGDLDDLHIYDKQLNSVEVVELYGLVGHWRLDETAGTLADDSSGAGNDGVYTNDPTLGVPGIHKTAVDFDGSNHVVVADAPNLNMDESLSVAAWIKPTPAPAMQHVFNKEGEYELAIYPDGSIRWAIANTNPGWSWHHTGQYVQFNRWTHIALTYNKGITTTYVDGKVVEIHNGSGSIGDHVSAQNTFQIGSRQAYNNLKFIGAIDEVYLYNRAVSAEEIVDLYGLLGHWKLDETFGTTVLDSSPAGNDGLYVGSPTLGATGVYDKAVSLNSAGLDDYLDLPAAALDGSLDVAVSFWIKTTNTGVQSVLSGAGPASFNEFIVYFSSDLSLAIYVHGVPVSWPVESIADDQWHHFVVVMDGAANQITIYRDGDSIGTKPHGPNAAPLRISEGGLIVGQEQDSIGGGFDASQVVVGELDDLRIYNRKLDHTEVAKLFGILGHWKVDETSGTLAADSSGAGNDGIYVNSPVLGAASFYEPKLGTAVKFDGTSRIDIPGLLGKPQDVTISGWAKLDTADAGGAELVSIGNAFAIRLDDYNNLNAFIYNGSHFSTRVKQNKPYAGLGWHHFAAVFNDANDVIELYVDGHLVNSLSTMDSISWTSAQKTTIGAHAYDDPDFDFNGSIDDVKIFSRALPPESIFNLYRGSRSNGLRIKAWVETR